VGGGVKKIMGDYLQAQAQQVTHNLGKNNITEHVGDRCFNGPR